MYEMKVETKLTESTKMKQVLSEGKSEMCSKSENEFYRKIFNSVEIDENLKQIIKNVDVKYPGGYKDEVLPIHWKPNSGYNNIVVCEHVCFNFELLFSEIYSF